MNRQRIIEAAERFEALPADYARFDVRIFAGDAVEVLESRNPRRAWLALTGGDTGYGTIGCIALWNALDVSCSVFRGASEFLELSTRQAREIFSPASLPSGYAAVGPREAAQALRNLAGGRRPLWEQETRRPGDPETRNSG